MVVDFKVEGERHCQLELPRETEQDTVLVTAEARNLSAFCSFTALKYATFTLPSHMILCVKPVKT